MYFYIYTLFLPWCFFPYNNICSVGSQFALGSTFLFHLHQESLLAVIITYLSVETPTCSPGDRSQIFLRYYTLRERNKCHFDGR